MFGEKLCGGPEGQAPFNTGISTRRTARGSSFEEKENRELGRSEPWGHSKEELQGCWLNSGMGDHRKAKAGEGSCGGSIVGSRVEKIPSFWSNEKKWSED